MPTSIRALILCTVFLASPCANGFELFTHALITFSAYRQARLGSDFSLLANLGLLNPRATLPYQHDPLGKNYLDLLSTQTQTLIRGGDGVWRLDAM